MSIENKSIETPKDLSSSVKPAEKNLYDLEGSQFPRGAYTLRQLHMEEVIWLSNGGSSFRIRE